MVTFEVDEVLAPPSDHISNPVMFDCVPKSSEKVNIMICWKVADVNNLPVRL